MRIIRVKNRRGSFWTVDGVASCGSLESAVDLAIDSLREMVKSAPVATLWTQYPVRS